MEAVVRYGTVGGGDVVTLMVDVDDDDAATVAAEVGTGGHATGDGTVSFATSGAESLRTVCAAAGVGAAGEAALRTAKDDDAGTADAWIVVDGAAVALRKGQRVRLVHTDDPYTALRPGAGGAVTGWSIVASRVVVDIVWDGGSRLSLIPSSGDRWRPAGDDGGEE